MDHDFTPQSNGNMLSEAWAKYFPYWPLFLVLIALAAAGAWFYSSYRLPVYETSASLLIKDEKKGTEDSEVLESLNPISGKKIIENEMEVLKSRALMHEVVLNLHLYAPVYIEQRWKDIPAYGRSPIRISAENPVALEEVERISFSYNDTAKTVVVDSATYPVNRWVKTPYGNLKFAETGEKAPQGKMYFELVDPRRVSQHLLKNLNVSPVSKLASVVTIKMEDHVPQRSEDVINGLIKAYSNASLNDKKILTTNTLAFLDERLKYVSKDLAEIEKRLQGYRAEKGAIDISSQGQLFLKNVSDNDQKLSDINMNLAVLNQVEQYVTSKNNAGGIVPSTVGIDDPILTSLLQKLYDAELEYERLKGTTAENNPLRVSVADQIQKIKPSILENIRSQRRSLEASKSNLNTTNSNYNAILQTLPQQEKDLVEINREHTTKSNIYSFLLQKREETALSNSSAGSNDSRIVDKAESTLDPVGLSNFVIFVVAVIIALLLGTAIISAKESFNSTVLFRQEIEAMTSFPVLAEISQEKSRMPVVLEKGKNSYIAEQFRMLRTSLPYLGIGSRGKKILITSTVPGDGKSFVTINLAMSLALTGKRVVIAEFDLSNPTLSMKLDMPASMGIADYLGGHGDLKNLIQKTNANPNLFLISAGTLPSNPSDMIVSDKVNDLLAYLDGTFDYVILDSAPVGILSDGYVLSKKCDATLYVIRHKHTPKKMLQRLDKNNEIHELKNIGLVFNGVSARGYALNRYGYGYGYSYINGNQKYKRQIANAHNS